MLINDDIHVKTKGKKKNVSRSHQLYNSRTRMRIKI